MYIYHKEGEVSELERSKLVFGLQEIVKKIVGDFRDW